MDLPHCLETGQTQWLQSSDGIPAILPDPAPARRYCSHEELACNRRTLQSSLPQLGFSNSSSHCPNLQEEPRADLLTPMEQPSSGGPAMTFTITTVTARTVASLAPTAPTEHCSSESDCGLDNDEESKPNLQNCKKKQHGTSTLTNTAKDRIKHLQAEHGMRIVGMSE